MKIIRNKKRKKQRYLLFQTNGVVVSNAYLYQLESDITAQTYDFVVAGVTGLEPAASGVTGRRSNQLSYTPMLSN